jgi:predicted AAA+ superfamily ATPase
MLARHWTLSPAMAFVAGPRQVGKTTLVREGASSYLNFDDLEHRRLLVKGGSSLAGALEAQRQAGRPLLAVFDELHKHRAWKSLLKGFYDVHGRDLRLVLTGSARLDVYRKGGDSLMGRYRLYHMHPFSVGELRHTELPPKGQLWHRPQAPDLADMAALWRHGGFPAPFVARQDEESRVWRRLRRQQLLREDLRDLINVSQISQLELLAQLLAERSAQALSYSNLAGDIGVSVDSVRRWVAAFEQLHWGFLLRPYSTRVARSLRKEPKWYLRDWSEVDDPGQRAETLLACHLLKSVDAWNDLGLGDFDLRYLRDSAKREVDFLVLKDRKPWLMVEAKLSDTQLSPALAHFQAQTGAQHALQAVWDLPYQAVDCFQERKPVVVPMQSLLAQLW